MAYTTTPAQRRATAKYRAGHQAAVQAVRRNYYAANRDRLKACQKEQYARKQKARLILKLETALAGIIPGRQKQDK